MRDLTLDKLPKRVLGNLDMETVFMASRCVIAAEQLMLFRILFKKELSAKVISKRTGILENYCEPYLDYLVYLGLLKKRNNLYSNTALANKHFIQERSREWSQFWSSECVKDFEAFSVLEDAIRGGKDWRKIIGKERKPDYILAKEDPMWAAGFTQALYDANKPDAKILANNIDLSKYRSLLDVGGGSGVMSMALARKYPKLKACVMDFEYVCAEANKIIRKERMSRQVKTIAGNMNKKIPSGFDVIMFWEIGQIDTRVMKMAYEKLPRGGMIVRSCRVATISKKLSPTRFLFSYLSVRPKGQKKKEKMQSLREAGFKSLKYRSIGHGLGLITGYK
jgi:hypothetical protein